MSSARIGTPPASASVWSAAPLIHQRRPPAAWNAQQGPARTPPPSALPIATNSARHRSTLPKLPVPAPAPSPAAMLLRRRRSSESKYSSCSSIELVAAHQFLRASRPFMLGKPWKRARAPSRSHRGCAADRVQPLDRAAVVVLGGRLAQQAAPTGRATWRRRTREVGGLRSIGDGLRGDRRDDAHQALRRASSEPGIEGVEHCAHLRQQRVVVVHALSRTCHDRFEASRLGHRLSADVELCTSAPIRTSAASSSSPKLATSVSNVTRSPTCVNVAPSKSTERAFGQSEGLASHLESRVADR